MTAGLKTCPVCGQIFDISFFTDYVYKKSINGQTVFYCGYNCMRTVEKKMEKSKKALTDEY